MSRSGKELVKATCHAVVTVTATAEGVLRPIHDRAQRHLEREQSHEAAVREGARLAGDWEFRKEVTRVAESDECRGESLSAVLERFPKPTTQ